MWLFKFQLTKIKSSVPQSLATLQVFKSTIAMEKSIGQPRKLERFSFSNRLKDTHSNSNEKVSALKLYPLAQIIRTLPSSTFSTDSSKGFYTQKLITDD